MLALHVVNVGLFTNTTRGSQTLLGVILDPRKIIIENILRCMAVFSLKINLFYIHAFHYFPVGNVLH